MYLGPVLAESKFIVSDPATRDVTYNVMSILTEHSLEDGRANDLLLGPHTMAQGPNQAHRLFLEITFYWSRATPSSYMVCGCFMVQSPVTATKPRWSINAKILTIWLFTKHLFCLICDIEQ